MSAHLEEAMIAARIASILTAATTARATLDMPGMDRLVMVNRYDEMIELH